VAWFALAILPVSNLLFHIGTVRADRLLFMPSLGFAMLVGWGAAALAQARPRIRRPLVVLLAVILVLYGWRSAARNLDWRSQRTLWNATILGNPGSSLAWSFMGDFSAEANDDAKAEECYLRAIELRDGAGFFYPEAHNRYADLLRRRGDLAGAEAQYRLVLSERPDQATALLNLGEMLLHSAETRDESIALLRRVTELTPEDFRAFANLAQSRLPAGIDDRRDRGS
jgi:predicted Zn-dependent protease